ncbi:pmbA protein putative modulatory Zn-dependent protease [endosymbiont of Euscepes postfasciatus]|uniref:metallopeptidase TldD-related protein n=1 Tax=endosymbiont of Euscepes postfasciatus TaxID=650377 RepID=UPI000DC73E21|nr:metallopeptidase TldD-related protein [endosymbiont of Euscepes postfasciatus]BBA84622.1 pmbA protein putative modulatory Zn-dependent protease [endosymbiont of Euscepes postfasciatus]
MNLKNKSEIDIINNLFKKNKFYIELLKKILNYIFIIKKVNFSYINIKYNICLEYSIKNNVFFLNKKYNSYINIFLYIKNKFINIKTYNFNIENIKNEINKYISFTTLINNNHIYIPDYHLMCFYPKNLNLLNFDDIFYNKNKFNIIQNIKNNIIDYSKKYNSITKVDDVTFYELYENFIYGNTYNVINNFYSSYYNINCTISSKNKYNITQKYDYINERSKKIINKIDKFGFNIVKESFLELNYIKIKSSISKIIIKNNIVSNIFLDFSRSINGKNIYLNKSYLKNYFNKKIFPSWMNIIEDPHILEEIGSCPFDKEGIETKKKFIIKNGILKNFLLDSFSSKMLKLFNTGNANGIYNWIFIIKHKKVLFDDLIKEMYNGILVTNIIGEGLNIFTGDYSQGISGFIIKNGIIDTFVNEITISGNLLQIFKNILLMSNDYNNKSIIKSGSIMIDNIKISGL